MPKLKKRKKKLPAAWRHYAKALALPLGTLALLYAASGSVVGVATTAVDAGSAPNNADAAVASSLAAQRPGAKLENLCAHRWGKLSTDKKVCAFRISYDLDLVRAKPLSVPIVVIPNDLVTVVSKNPPTAVVGAEKYDADAAYFQARSEGELTFYPRKGKPVYEAQRVLIDRCFRETDGVVGTVPCLSL